MAYRFNERENVLREQYETAKATLEELAEKRNYGENTFRRLNNALVDLGFRREAIAKDKIYGDTAVYIRENKNSLEVLADRDLAGDRLGGKRVTSFYLISAGQEVQEWYHSIPNFDEWKAIHKRKVGTIGLSGMSGSVLVGAVLGFFIDQYVGAFLGSLISPVITGGTALVYQEKKKHPLHNQTIAKGPDALRYIANTSFEDFVRFNNSRTNYRIESKPRIIDAEFTDENAIIDKKTYQEQVREALAIEETEKQKKQK